MILFFSILNDQKSELFQKYFVERTYFSIFQVKTIANSVPKLLNIVELTSKYEKSIYSSRFFTITNLWIHIIKFKTIFYVFVTPAFYFSNKPLNFEQDYETLIKQIHELQTQCTRIEPYFSLIQNNYFMTNVEACLIQFNKHFVKNYSKLKSEKIKEKEIQLSSNLNGKIGKYLIIGPANVGKSSIIAQFFLNWDQEQIKNIRPTINKQSHNFKDSLINQNFNLIDLGGQVQYTEMHLKDSNLFIDVKNIFYVIDVQDTKRIDFTKNYLIDILTKLQDQNEAPFITIFLHKYDPEVQEQLSENVQEWIFWLDQNLSKSTLEYTYYFTSVKDKSAREAFARTLLLSLPYWFLTLTIKEDLIIRSLNSLLPIVNELTQITKGKEDLVINAELFRQSVLFGFATTKIITQKWINHLLNKNDNETVNINSNEQNDMDLVLDKDNSLIQIKFKCPLLSDDKYKKFTGFSGVCEVTHGLLSGLSQFIGLGETKILETQIRNESEYCHFNISI